MTLSTYSNNLPANQNEWALLLDQARCFLQSGLLPKALQKPEQVVLVMLKGRELGIPPLQALSHINVIGGKPAMSAELMLAQILKLHPKTQFKFPERTNERCTISVKALLSPLMMRGKPGYSVTLAGTNTLGLCSTLE